MDETDFPYLTKWNFQLFKEEIDDLNIFTIEFEWIETDYEMFQLYPEHSVNDSSQRISFPKTLWGKRSTRSCLKIALELQGHSKL